MRAGPFPRKRILLMFIMLLLTFFFRAKSWSYVAVRSGLYSTMSLINLKQSDKWNVCPEDSFCKNIKLSE